MEIESVVTGKYNVQEKWENGVEGGSVNKMMLMGSYPENTVIENAVIGNTENTVIEK